MLSGDLEALGGFKEKLFEYGAVFTDAENKEATMFCYVLFRLAEHQVALAAKDLTGMVLLSHMHRPPVLLVVSMPNYEKIWCPFLRKFTWQQCPAVQ